MIFDVRHKSGKDATGATTNNSFPVRSDGWFWRHGGLLCTTGRLRSVTRGNRAARRISRFIASIAVWPCLLDNRFQTFRLCLLTVIDRRGVRTAWSWTGQRPRKRMYTAASFLYRSRRRRVFWSSVLWRWNINDLQQKTSDTNKLSQK